jgi:dTDP-glucose 4,6-dehydratase
MKSVFITGSEGFFGSTLVEHLLKKNYRVKALVQYNSFQSAGWLDHLREDEKNFKKI